MTITLTSLKAQHESGEKVSKYRRRLIRKQLARVCMRHGCQESLAFRKISTKYHNDSCRLKANTAKKHKKPTKAQNAAKKKRYYEAHGITFNKNIRRNVTPATQNYKPLGDDVTLIYENYKEPLKSIPKAVGFGYYGTVAQTADHDWVQCHICGDLFENVGLHIKLHKLSAKSYKEKFGLNLTTALCSDNYREKRQQLVFKPGNKELPVWLDTYNKKVQSGEVKHKAHGKGMSLEERNKRGLCPEQVLEPIRKLAEELGRTPSQDEFYAVHKGKYESSFTYHYGGWFGALKKLKMTSREEMRHPKRDDLLQDLEDFYKKHNRIPMTSDFNRGLLRDKGVYIRVFGSLNNARLEAGMDAVLPLPFGKIVQLSAEEYAEYKLGHGLSKEAIRSRKYREKQAQRPNLQVGYGN